MGSQGFYPLIQPFHLQEFFPKDVLKCANGHLQDNQAALLTVLLARIGNHQNVHQQGMI